MNKRQVKQKIRGAGSATTSAPRTASASSRAPRSPSRYGGAQRKADRIRQHLERDDERHDAAVVIDNGTLTLPDLRTTEPG